MRPPPPRLLALLLPLGLLAGEAHAQTLQALFPEGVPGAGTETGVTVRSRARPAYEPLGIRIGLTTLRPSLTTSLGYDDNVFAGRNRRGSWRLATTPSLLATTAWADASLGLFFSADDTRYPNQPSQNRTDATAFMGGAFGIGRDRVTLGAGFASGHQDRTELDALPSDRPVGFRVEDARAAYAIDLGRLAVTPAAEITHWSFGSATVAGVPVSQALRDRTTAKAETTARYDWMPARALVFVARLLDTRYEHRAAGIPANDSTSGQALLGVDYDDNAVWRFRLLGGAQVRVPAAAAYRTETTALAEGEAVWSPSGMTTLRATLARGVEDAAQTGLSSYTYTSARLTIDHEYLRNLLLTASATLRHAEFHQTGGRQLGFGLNAGATWLIDRNARLSLTYDLAEVRNARLPANAVAGDYTRNLLLLSLRLAL